MHWLDKLLKKVFKIREDADGEVVKPFLDHLEDLRWMLIKMISTLSAGMILSFFFRKWLFEALTNPLRWVGLNPPDMLILTAPADSILVSLTLAFYAGIILTFPLLLFFLLEFILPALTRQEKKMIMPGIAVGFLLFISGVLACYYLVLPQTLRWLWADSVETLHVRPTWTVAFYVSFVTRLCLGFGILIEIPPIMIALAGLGIVSHEWLTKTRPYAIVLILLVTAFIAPSPDLITFLSLGVPVVTFYEICIWIVWLIERRRARLKPLDDGF